MMGSQAIITPPGSVPKRKSVIAHCDPEMSSSIDLRSRSLTASELKQKEADGDDLDAVHVFASRERRGSVRSNSSVLSSSPKLRRPPREPVKLARTMRRRSMKDIEDLAKSAVEERFKLKEVNGPPGFFMTKIQRHAITGKCYLDEVPDERNFSLVCLRQHNIEEKEWGPLDIGSGYLYSPQPLVARSWFYHELNRANNTGDTDRYTHSIRSRIAYALSLKVNDDHQCGCYGAGSPAKGLSIMLFSTGVVEDFTALFLVIIAFVSTVALSIYCNNLQFYRSCRLITFPLRWLLLVWNLAAMLGIPGELAADPPKYHVVVALLINVGVCGYDFVEDFAAWYSGAEETSWNIVKMLPGKVMICTRVCNSSDSRGKYRKLDYPPFLVGSDKHLRPVLIAEIAGALFILKPLALDDVDGIVRWCRLTQARPRVYCTRSFSDEHRTADSFDEMGLLKVTEVGQMAKREAVIHRITMMEMKQDVRRTKALENQNLVEAPLYKKMVDSLLNGFNAGPVWDSDDFSDARNKLLGIEIHEESATTSAIFWEDEQRKRAENPYARKSLSKSMRLRKMGSHAIINF